MNYHKIYQNIIDKAISLNRSKKESTYYENHHIIPRCIGGNDDKDNLVLLTAKEHFISHLLLVKIYPDNNKLKFAFWGMCNQLKGDVDRKYKISASIYKFAKEEHAKANSLLHKGKTISQKQKEQISKRHSKEGNANWNKKGELNHLYNIERPQYVRDKITESKLKYPKRNISYKGYFVTPFGIFYSHFEMVRSLGFSFTKFCKNSKSNVTQFTLREKYNKTYNFFFKEEHYGKTFKELGFDFIKEERDYFFTI